MMKKTNKNILIFLLLFAAAIAVTCFIMPKATVHAYRGDTTYHGYNVGSELYIEKVDKDGEQIDGAVISVASARYSKGSSTPDITDDPKTYNIGEALVGNDYLDYVVNGGSNDGGNGYFFSWENENIAIMTITETKAPEDYKELSEPIVLKYWYEDEYGNTIVSDTPSQNAFYNLKVEVLSGPQGEYELEVDEVVQYYDKFSIYTLKIINEKKGFREEYQYEGELPDEVMATIPTRKGNYQNGDVVTPEDPSSTSVTVGNKTYTFLGWTPTSVTIDNADAVFKGKWSVEEETEEKVKITYKLNGGQYGGSTADIIETYDKNEWFKIHAAPEREGYEFLYWKGSEYQPGDDYQATEDHTFTAMWKKGNLNKRRVFEGYRL